MASGWSVQITSDFGTSINDRGYANASSSSPHAWSVTTNAVVADQYQLGKLRWSRYDGNAHGPI